MSFAKIKGQDSAISFLKAAFKNNRLSHAYIFSGPGGVGKMFTALSFAKAILCENATLQESCDRCPVCRKIDNLSHPDLFILRPDKKSASIKIDDVRQLIKDIYLKPFEAKKKVYIIDGAETMKHEAANALLKTLEEPPTDSVLILITNNLKALFHTIVSRSQVVRFFTLKAADVKDILIKEYSLDEPRAHVLSCLSGGRLGEALRHRDEDVFQLRDSLINGASKGSLLGFSFDDMPKEKNRACLDILLSWFRDILTVKAGAPFSMVVNIDKIDLVSGEAKRLSFEYLQDVIANIVSTSAYLDQNVNQKLAMSVLGLKLASV